MESSQSGVTAREMDVTLAAMIKAWFDAKDQGVSDQALCEGFFYFAFQRTIECYGIEDALRLMKGLKEQLVPSFANREFQTLSIN